MLEAAELEACAAAAIHDREPGEDFPHGQVWLVQTISGSVYRIRRAADDQ